jgi:hypothetical protein
MLPKDLLNDLETMDEKRIMSHLKAEKPKESFGGPTITLDRNVFDQITLRNEWQQMSNRLGTQLTQSAQNINWMGAQLNQAQGGLNGR